MPAPVEGAGDPWLGWRWGRVDPHCCHVRSSIIGHMGSAFQGVLVSLAVVLLLQSCGGPEATSTSTVTTPSADAPSPAPTSAKLTPPATAPNPADLRLPTLTPSPATSTAVSGDVSLSYSRRTPFVPLDNPAVISAKDAAFLEPDDRVLGVTVNGESRAYPLNMMTFHHIANDTIDGRPILITF